LILRRKDRGMKLAVVDPRRTRLAQHADLHLAVRPGTDLALALALLGVVVREARIDGEFVASNTLGFEELAAAVEPLTPQWAAALTGVDATLIERLAREIAAAKNASGATGLAIEHAPTGVQACRAIEALWAVTGNVGRPGGIKLLGGAGADAFATQRELAPTPPPIDQDPVGAKQHPLFTRLLGEAQGVLLPRAILEDDPYPVRALGVFGANPALSAPDSIEMQRALERLDLLVVADPEWSETARLADVVLPAASFLERDSFIAMRGIGEVPAAVRAPGQAWPDTRIVFELARRLGLSRYFPWADRSEARKALAGARRPLDKARYRTPSGKIELASARIAEAGLAAVPTPVGLPDPDPEFPLLLVTGLRRPGYCNSQMRGAPLVEGRVGPPTLRLAPKTAESLGVTAGQRVRVETAHGALDVDAHLDRDLLAGIVVLPHCDAEANANLLTSTSGLDPLSGFPNLRSVPCRVSLAARRSG
jgi:anaerobic selenocysteine-containing dehydrogenase